MLLIALFALSCVARAHPRKHRHRRHRPAVELSALALSSTHELGRGLIADHVALHAKGFEKTISIRFGNLETKQLAFITGTEGQGSLIAGDIDRDGDIDLVWVGSPAGQNTVVWINQGEGNFVEAADSGMYSRELDGLFNFRIPRGKRSLRQRRKTSSLTSSFFAPIERAFVTSLLAPATQQSFVRPVQRIPYGLVFLSSLPERGPPQFLS